MFSGCRKRLLLTLRLLSQGIGKSELVAKVVWLKSAIEARGGKVADFGDMTVEEVVDRSVSMETSVA